MMRSLRKFSLMLAPVAALGFAAAPSAIAQDEDVLKVLTINGKEFSLNLVGSIVNQLPDNIRQQPLGAYYDNVIDDVIDTHLTAEAARAAVLLKTRY